MKRLTGYNKYGSVYAIGMGAGNNTEIINAILKRLSAYEDTGLEPQEVSGLCEMDKRSRMAKMLRWEQAEAEGRLVELPCKVWDTVYRICPKSNNKHDGSCENCAWRSCMTNCGCTTYGLWGDGQFPPDKCTIVPYKVSWNYIPNMMEKFGKTVFLTRELAEEALNEQKKL